MAAAAGKAVAAERKVGDIVPLEHSGLPKLLEVAVDRKPAEAAGCKTVPAVRTAAAVALDFVIDLENLPSFYLYVFAIVALPSV